MIKIFILLILCSLTLAHFESINLKDKVPYIVDGDSISVQMRIVGMDAPEIGQKCQKTKNNKIIDCGFLAKYYLRKILQDSSNDLIIEYIGVDKYNRILVRAYNGKDDIAKLMVEAGIAYSYGKKYKLVEQEARQQKLGFWNFFKPPIKPYKWRRFNRKNP